MPENRILSDWLDAYMQFTDNSEPSHQFRLWTGISTVAAALQRKVSLEWGTLTFYPNMYIVLVGPSASRKGTAMKPAADLLEATNIQVSASSTTLQALIRRMSEANHVEHDTATGKVIAHSSMTVFSEEFTVFLKAQDQDMMSVLCDWYDCKNRFVHDTKSQGVDEILGVWLNLLAATTPAMIRSSLPLDAVGGGLTSRMILVFAPRKGKTVFIPLLTPAEKQLRDALQNDLEHIKMLKGQFRITEDFLDAWCDWYKSAEDHPPEHLDHRFDGYVSRRPTHVMKLSMILSASRSGELIISKQDLTRATSILESVERRMPYAFSGMGQSPISELLPRVTAFIAKRGQCSFSDLMSAFASDADIFTLEKRILATLVGMNYIRIDYPSKIIQFTGPKEVEQTLGRVGE